jgi:drug/metabolite transporter (DMT)-like permease
MAAAEPGARKRRDHGVLAPLALVAGVFCIGFSAIFVKLAALPGPVSALYRVAIAAVVVVPVWLATRKPGSLPDSRAFVPMIAGGLFFALDITLWNTSLRLAPAATATLLANNSPLWVGLASFLVFRERLGWRYWLGLALALAGMAWLVGLGAIRRLDLGAGNLLAVGASVFYAAFMLTTQRARAKGRVDLMTFMAVSTLASVALLLPLNLALGSTLAGFPPRVWLALAGLGLVSQLGGWLAINYALGHMPASQVSVCLLSQSVVTALLSIPILGEAVHANQVVGGALVLAGIYWVTARVPAAKIPD